MGRYRNLLIAAFACAAVRAPAATTSGPIRVISDVRYLGPGRGEKLDLYLPERPPGGPPLSAVVYFHGGGWVKGDKTGPRDTHIARSLAAAGYAVASADYRLGRGAWPTNLEDCRNAVRFVRSHAAEYGIDPRRIAAMGASAGAHLALMVAFTRAQDQVGRTGPYPGISCAVGAAVDLYGITDLLSRQVVNAGGAENGELDDAHSAEMLGVSRRDGAAIWRAASPVFQITHAAPPVLIVHGLADTIVDHAQAIELADALKARDIPHELVLLKGVGHLFDLQHSRTGWPLPLDLRPVVIRFLAATLPAGS